jgi:hypothetical protein
MPATTVDGVESVATRWRTTDAPDSPAGPLFSSQQAQADIVMNTELNTTIQCGTACSYSSNRECC